MEVVSGNDCSGVILLLLAAVHHRLLREVSCGLTALLGLWFDGLVFGKNVPYVGKPPCVQAGHPIQIQNIETTTAKPLFVSILTSPPRSNMSRRHVIEDSDSDDDDMGVYAPFLKRSGQGYVLDKNRHEEFINLIPQSNDGVTQYQMHIITSVLRASDKKIRIKLFRQNKAEVIFGSWWDYCLTQLADGLNENVKNLLSELLNFTTVLHDIIKNKGDLKKAKDRMRVDLVQQMEATKAAIDNVNDLDDIKAQSLSVGDHFRKVYEVEIGASSSQPADSAAAPSQSAAASQPGGIKNGPGTASQDKAKAAAPSTSGTTTSEDRKAAAAQKRLESMKKTQMRRVGVTSSPAKPSANDSGWGARASAAAPAHNSSAANDGGWGARAPAPDSSRNNSASNGGSSVGQASAPAPPGSTNSSSNDGGWGRHSSAPAPAHNESTNNDGGWGRHVPAPAPGSDFEPMFPGDDGSPDGWGRRPNTNPEQSTETEAKKAQEKDKPYRMWGPLNRKIPPYPESSSSSRNDRDSQTNQSRYTAREPETNRSYQGSNQGLNDSRNNVAHGDRPNHQQSNYSSTDRASNGFSSMASSVPQSTRQPSNYRSYESSRNDAHDSRSNLQSYSGSNDRVSSTYDSQSNRQFPGSSVTEPYSHGGNIRNNQPVGGTGSTMGGSTGYRSNNNDPQQRDQFLSHRDDTGYSRGPRPQIQFTPREDIDPSRRGSYEHDKRDSGASSYHSRSNERANDRRDYEDRMRDERPPSNSHRYDDDRRESSRGSGGSSGRRCNYFFSEKGCRNGANCRFSHEDDGGDKPSSDRLSERGRRRNFEDGGSEDGELRPTKRFRGPQPSVINVSNAPLAAAETGRGRGRGAHLNKPAWMTQAENGQSGPSNAAATSTLPMNNSDLLNVLSSVSTPAPSVAIAAGPRPAGPGRGRGTDNRPAWMTQSETTGSASATMNGRFAPPPGVQRNNPPPEQATGRGRGRGTDNRPAWMTRTEK